MPAIANQARCKHGMTAEYCALCSPGLIDARHLDNVAERITAIIMGEDKMEEETTAEEIPKKTCNKCGESKPIDRKYFEPNKACKDGYVGICRICRNKANAERNRAKQAAKRKKKPPTQKQAPAVKLPPPEIKRKHPPAIPPARHRCVSRLILPGMSRF